jgi:hypothetical protein
MIIDGNDLYIMPLKVKTILILKSKFIDVIGALNQLKDSLLLYHKLIRSITDFNKLKDNLLISDNILESKLFRQFIIKNKPYKFSVMSPTLKEYDKKTRRIIKASKEKSVNEFFSRPMNWLTKILPFIALLVTLILSITSIIISSMKKVQ